MLRTASLFLALLSSVDLGSAARTTAKHGQVAKSQANEATSLSMSGRANVNNSDNLCCMLFSGYDGYFELVAGGESGKVPHGINSMSDFLAEASVTSRADTLVLDVVYGIDASDLLQGAQLMKDGTVDFPVLHDLRDESKSGQTLASVYDLVLLQSGATSVEVVMPKGTTGEGCGSCDGKVIIEERLVIKTLLDIAIRYPLGVASEMTHLAERPIHRMKRAKYAAMIQLTKKYGSAANMTLMTMTKSELNSYLSDICGEEASMEDRLTPERLVKVTGRVWGRVKKVRKFVDFHDRKQHVQSCVDHTRATFAVVQFSKQFLEPLTEGLKVVLEPEGKTFRTLLEERQTAAESMRVHLDALYQMKPWIKDQRSSKDQARGIEAQ